MFKPAAFLAIIISCTPFTTEAYSLRGTHPHDQSHRIVRTTSAKPNGSTWGYRRIAAFENSYHRTTGMYLHPYYRQPLLQRGEYRFGRLTEYARRHPYAYQMTQLPYRQLGY